jgi:hypothetical protein
VGKSKGRKTPSQAKPRGFTPGDQFAHSRALRQRARMALASLKPAQMPLLLDALDEMSTPILEYLEPYGLVVPDLGRFRATRTVGPALEKWCKILGVSPETLLVNRERYFGFGSDASNGEVDEPTMVALYCAHRCTSGATADRHAYYASEEMTALILAGSETAAGVSVTVADLPSPTGVAYLAHTDGGLVLMWQVLDDDLLSVQLIPAFGVQEFITHDGTRREGWGYRFINHMYLPIPTAEAELSPPESDAPPCLHSLGGFTPGLPDDAPRDVRGIYHGWTTGQILEVFISFTHMLRQGSRMVETSTISAPRSAVVGRRRGPSEVTYLTYRPRTSARAADGQAPTRNYSHRWTVRGHWKQHWYSSEKRHHPIWISTYIAGPEGAPIKSKDKVTVLQGPSTPPAPPVDPPADRG